MGNQGGRQTLTVGPLLDYRPSAFSRENNSIGCPGRDP